MDISKYTPAQQDSIKHEGSHLFIEAGAGTGKTATLTAKVAYLLSRRNRLAFEHISQLLAITFTNLAAGELTSRIRSTLRAEGLADEALLVDDAWVSTIHGMCSRILRDHAFELGIDPTFTVIGEVRAAELMGQAVDTAIREVSADGEADAHGGPESADALFSEYDVRPPGGFGSKPSISGFLVRLIDKIASLPHGADDLYTGPEPLSPVQVATWMREALLDVALALEAVPKATSTTLGAADAARSQAALLGEADDDLAALEVLKGLLAESALSCRQKDDDAKRAVAEYREVRAFAADELNAWVAWPHLGQLIQLAQSCDRRYHELKHAEGALDNTDLLRLLHDALRSHPDIAQGYADRFRLIMIDEFQDTDLLQTRIARILSGQGTGELVCVGDAQQAIYRFRGADVNLFRSFAESLPQDAARLRLKTNFRSHPDILAFVNSVFGAPEVFGEGYLDLEAPDSHRVVPGPVLPAGMPRIDIVMTTSRNAAPGKPGVDAAVRRDYEAAAIAERFRELIASGWQASQMAILLRGMTHAQVYAHALRARGIESVITGGSVFWQQPEPILVGMLLRLLANPRDNEAAYQVLASEVFGLASPDLAALATKPAGGTRALFEGLRSDEQAGACVGLARTTVMRALRQVRTERPSAVVRRILVESGLIARLENAGPSGMASCANYLKAIRAIEDIEAEGACAVAPVCLVYQRLAQSNPKEQPGTLMAGSQDAVRIMTIHASKGLEFPVVALVGFDGAGGCDEDLLLEPCGERVAVDLLPSRTHVRLKERLPKPDLSRPPMAPHGFTNPRLTRGAYHRRLATYSYEQDSAECRRLFYVGATRAKSVLILAMHPTHTKDGTFSMTQIQADVARLFDDGQFPLENACATYGGSDPARYTCTRLARGEDGEVITEGESDVRPLQVAVSSAAAMVPVPGDVERYEWLPQEARVSHEFSYSSLAAAHGALVQGTGGAQGAQSDGSDEGSGQMLHDDEKATELGLAFHRCAELMVLEELVADGSVRPLGSERVEKAVTPFKLSDAQHARLDSALDRWVASDVAKRAAGYPVLRAEVPFCLPFEVSGQETAEYLVGEIDLLCLDEGGRRAFIVDYKTGGDDGETPKQLQDKHRLQALCYASAVFVAGVQDVEFAFTRVERDDGTGQPQVVSYRFDISQCEAIREEILSALQA